MSSQSLDLISGEMSGNEVAFDLLPSLRARHDFGGRHLAADCLGPVCQRASGQEVNCRFVFRSPLVPTSPIE